MPNITEDDMRRALEAAVATLQAAGQSVTAPSGTVTATLENKSATFTTP